MKKRIFIAWCVLLAASAWAEISGSFIQLHRGKTERTVEEWRADFKGIKALGGTMLIVQWVAEEPVLFFEPDNRNSLPEMDEAYPVLERIFEAAESEGMELILGLQHHPEYWDQIKGREKVIRDFFRIRMARNHRLQQALLHAFGDRSTWTGYYIPDEIDDFTWRGPSMAALMRDYLQQMTAILRENDPGRSVSVSAFFRGRTAPDYVVENFAAILADTGIDYLMLQDGVGVGEPPLAYVHLFYQAFADHWGSDQQAEHLPLPALWGVIETFEQVSGPDQPFVAVGASADRIQEQISVAQPFFDRLILFTFDDYIDLANSAQQRLLP